MSWYRQEKSGATVQWRLFWQTFNVLSLGDAAAVRRLCRLVKWRWLVWVLIDIKRIVAQDE